MAGTVTVDQAKLVLNSFAAIFQNNLTSAELVTWRKFDNEMNDRNALTVVEQVTPRYVVTRTTSGVQDLTTPGTQNTVFGSEQYKIDTVFGSSMGWQDFVKIRDIGAARESEALKAAALNLAEQIDAYILNFAINASNNWLGTPGSVIAQFTDVANGYTRLKEEGVTDADLRAILTYGDKQALGEAVSTPVNSGGAVLSQIGSGIYRNGWEGMVAGVPTLFTQQIAPVVTGTHGTSTFTASGGTNVHYSDVAISPAPGQYMTQTVSLSIGSGTETIKDGEVFTIDSVYAYDNRLQAPLDHLQEFRVIGNYTATGGAVTGVRIFPAMIIPSAFSNTAQVNNDTAHATVSVAPTDGATITWVTPASSTVRPRAILNKDAIVVNTADLIMPATGIGSRKALTKVPLSVRMWQNSVFNTGEHQVRFDVALAANVVDRRRIVRINGD